MQRYRSLLVAVDFGPCSAAALRQALRLSAQLEAEIQVLHVVDTLVSAGPQERLSEIQRDIREGLRAEAHDAWREFAEAIPGAPELAFEVGIDGRVAGIVRHARATGSDLLVLGAFGRDPHLGLGSVASGCVRSAPCDVLVIRETRPGPFRTLVAAVDFSETSADALRCAADVSSLDGAALRVVHVQHSSRAGERRTEALEAFVRRTLPSPPASLVCEVFDEGSHRSAIAAYAEQVKADLVVLGTRGRTNFRDTLLGSTAEKALALSSCSVLAVRAAER